MATAERGVAEFHNEFNRSGYAAIYAASHPELKSASSESDFVKFLETVHRKLGTVTSAEQQGWRVNQHNLDTNVLLSYRTTFSSGSVAAETFAYRVDDKTAMLLSYNINSKDLILK